MHADVGVAAADVLVLVDRVHQDVVVFRGDGLLVQEEEVVLQHLEVQRGGGGWGVGRQGQRDGGAQDGLSGCYLLDGRVYWLHYIIELGIKGGRNCMYCSYNQFLSRPK